MKGLARYDARMGTEMVFSGGHRVLVQGSNAETLIQTLNLPGQGRVRTPTGSLAEGWVNIQTEDESSGELNVQGRKGEIRQKDTVPHGHDPYPPKG